MFKTLGKCAYRLRYLWIAAGAACLLVGILYGVDVFGSLKDGGIDDPSTGSAHEAIELEREFPNSRISLILLVHSGQWTVDQSEYQLQVRRLTSLVESSSSGSTAVTFYDTKDNTFVSRDRHSTFVLVNCRGNQDEAYRTVAASVQPFKQLDIQVGGPAAANVEINDQVQKDLPKLGAFSLPALLILLILIFRSVIAALLPLLIGAVSVLGAFAVLHALCAVTDISVFAANIVSLLGLGLAVDYSLLYVSRFRDELAEGKTVSIAIETASATAGEAIFLSGSTVALSLIGLLVFPQMFLRSMGLGGAIAVLIAMVASLTVLPALLSALGKNVDFFALTFLFPNQTMGAKPGRWRAIGQFVVRWPVPVLALSLGVLLLTGMPFLHVKFANPSVSSLPSEFSSRRVADRIARDFPGSPNPPVEILLKLPLSPISLQGVADTRHYTAAILALSGVRSVNGFIGPISSLSDVDVSALLSGADTLFESPAQQANIANLVSRYVSGNTTLLTVNYRGNPDSGDAQSLVKAIRLVSAPIGTTVLVGGQSAELVDRLHSLSVHLPVALSIIFTATFIVLMLLLSSIVIPLKAILLNTLSLSAAFGAMTWIFQDGHLHNLLHFTSSQSLDPTLPVLIFAIAFGLATDYEVFLVTRIKEEYLRTGDNTAAVVVGVEKTGGIITSAGLLLVVVVAAFGLGEILSMKEMGVGLAIAVAVDAAIVRTFLVPAAMQLFDRLNWWLPWGTKGLTTGSVQSNRQSLFKEESDSQ